MEDDLDLDVCTPMINRITESQGPVFYTGQVLIPWWQAVD